MNILIFSHDYSDIPYYDIAYSITPDIFNKSGNWELVEKLGDWFSYDKTPRQQKNFANYLDKTINKAIFNDIPDKNVNNIIIIISYTGP